VTSHPRDSYDLENAIRRSGRSWTPWTEGRLHHAWLLTGPEGIGKASFAYRAARRLLGAAPAPEHGPLGASPDDAVSRLVAARAHPDLMVLEREADSSGKLKKSISAEAARGLPEFFARTRDWPLTAWRSSIAPTT
jgi:DNA polymerase-3 subunit delta'